MEKIELPWQSMGHLLQDSAVKYADRKLIIYEGESITFQEANQHVNRIANMLVHLGLESGDRVSVMLPNGFESPLTWLAIAKAGLVIVPTNNEYQEHDLQYTLKDAGVACIVIHSDYLKTLESVRDTLPDLEQVIVVGANVSAPYLSYSEEIAQFSDEFEAAVKEDQELLNIQYTSGTTGFPKGCMLSHRHWLLMGHIALSGLDIQPGDVHFNAQPFYYMDGQWNLSLCLMAGVPLVLIPRFSVSGFWKTVVDNGVTFFYCLGTMPVMLLNREPDDLEKKHKVRAVSCSGIVPDMHAEIEARFNSPWREGYGTTESGTDMFVPYEDTSCVGTGTLGYPISSKEEKLVDPEGNEVAPGEPGELLMRGEPMMLGYWNNPEATAESIVDGWFHSGDLFSKDESGRYFIVGRVKDMVRRGGENISSAEVEGILMGHDKVGLAAVVPVPDPIRGEEVKAYILPRDGVAKESIEPNELIEYARRKLAKFKVPRYIEFVDAFPTTASERIEKRKLIDAKDDLRKGSWDAADDHWIE